MRSFLTIIFIVTLIQCSKKEPFTFDRKTKEIFLDGDNQNHGKSFFEFYKTSEFLSLDPPPQGYTTYPPLSALGLNGRTDYHTFRFKKHPYLSIPFREGELIITSRDKNNTKVYSEPILKFFFDTKEQLEVGYSQLV